MGKRNELASVVDCAPTAPVMSVAGTVVGTVAGALLSKRLKMSKGPVAATNEIATINLTIRAVNLSKARTSANNDLAFDLQKEMKASPLFDANETQFSGQLSEDDNSPTFTFPMKIKLKRPMKL